MMCSKCRKAGHLLGLLGPAAVQNVHMLFDMHEQCEYPGTCTCQHVTETVLSRPKVPA